jgi:hypothetical protein
MARKKPKAAAAKPVVRLVTPADKSDAKHASRDAFEKLIKKLYGTKIDYQPCYGKYDIATLTTVATQAVKDADAASATQKVVIVTAGAMATTIVLGLTPTIPIIQAFGENPTIPPNRTNVTGFKIDAAKTAQDQLALLTGPVVVLYDDTPDPNNPSNYIYSQLPAAKLAPPITARTPLALKHLSPAKLLGANGFMLIPNAMFYNHCDDIANFVDGKKAADGITPLPIFYPEHEYKDAHTTKTGVRVLGHHARLTYRNAAVYVDDILSGGMDITTLPPIGDAVPDQG